MNRRTALPGIWVRSIEIEKPPFDEPGLVKEYVGRGVMRELEPMRIATEFESETVSDFVDSAEDMIGPLRDTYRIKYNLMVAAFPSRESPDIKLASKLQKRSISIRARIFARAKNPFEPDVINVGQPRENPEMSGEKLGDVYDVSVAVTK